MNVYRFAYVRCDTGKILLVVKSVEADFIVTYRGKIGSIYGRYIINIHNFQTKWIYFIFTLCLCNGF